MAIAPAVRDELMHPAAKEPSSQRQGDDTDQSHGPQLMSQRGEIAGFQKDAAQNDHEIAQGAQ